MLFSISEQTSRGAAALERLKVFEGVPPPYDRKKKMVVPSALRVLRLKPGRKYCTLKVNFRKLTFTSPLNVDFHVDFRPSPFTSRHFLSPLFSFTSLLLEIMSGTDHSVRFHFFSVSPTRSDGLTVMSSTASRRSERSRPPLSTSARWLPSRPKPLPSRLPPRPRPSTRLWLPRVTKWRGWIDPPWENRHEGKSLL